MNRKLYNILRDIYEMDSREEILIRSVNEKLNTSYDNYSNEVNKMCEYLLYRNSTKVLNNILKIQGKEK